MLRINMDISTKEFTDKQSSFLEAFLGEARGNIRLAMDMAGYSKSTKTHRSCWPSQRRNHRTCRSDAGHERTQGSIWYC